MFDEFTALFGNDSFGDDIEVESATSQLSNATLVRGMLGNDIIPTCSFCGCDMPVDRRNQNRKFTDGRKFKYCSDACRIDAANAKRKSKIIDKNGSLTAEINRLRSTKDRNAFLLKLTGDYIRFHIGFFRDDRAMQNKMRLQAEAITNAFLFKSRADKSIYHYFIAYLHEHHSAIATRLFDPSALLVFAQEIGLVSMDHSAPFPVMIDHREDEDMPKEETKSSNEQYTKIATNTKEQIIYSGLLKFATTHKKKSDWASWVFEDHFGHAPDGLMNVEASITDEVMNIIRDTSKRYADVRKPRKTATHAPVEARKAPMEAVTASPAPAAPEVVQEAVEAPKEAHGKIIASSFNERVEVFADYYRYRMKDMSIDFSVWAKLCGYEDTSIRDALDFMRNVSESDERRMVVYFKRCGIPESVMF